MVSLVNIFTSHFPVGIYMFNLHLHVRKCRLGQPFVPSPNITKGFGSKPFPNDLSNIRQMLHLYRNQSIDLQYKSIDWFLYECDIGLINVNKCYEGL